MHNRTILLLIVATLAMPAATAAWGAKGDSEPNHLLDQDGYMFASPNVEKLRKVYFNGFSGACVGYFPCASTSFNPNVGSLGTQIINYPYQAYAMLGVWRDCNRDGFVGYGEQGAFEYVAQLPGVDPALCPVETLPNPLPFGTAPVHNDGKLVREFLPIGWTPISGNVKACNSANPSVCADTDPYDFHDNGARVWADWGVPTDPPGNQCYVRPHPRGTWHSVGQAQEWADCFLQNRIQETIDANGLGSIYASVKGSDCEQSSAVAYRPGCNPYGEYSQKPYVDAFACDKNDQAFQGPARTNVSRPRSVPTVNPDGSMAGTMNETHGDTTDCRENDSATLPDEWQGPYSTEADLGNQNGLRQQHDMVMFYNNEPRPASPPIVYNAIGRQTPQDLGLRTVGTEDLWSGNSVTAASRNPFMDRASLGVAPVSSMTFYAHVSALAISDYSLRLPGPIGSYGSEACGTTPGPGVASRNGWDCDPTNWWGDQVGNCRPGVDDGCQNVNLGGANVPAYVRPGQAYNLRDVDCWDFSAKALRDEGVHWGMLTGTSCPAPN